MRDRELAVQRSELKSQASIRALRLQSRKLLLSGLGANPAVDCLKTVFGFDSVVAVPRESIRNRSHGCMDANWVRRVGIQLDIKESNFNVSAVWRRVAAIEDASHSLVPHTRHLVHPRGNLLSRSISITKRQQEQLKVDGITGELNLMTSQEFEQCRTHNPYINTGFV
jgi:hypothetical protein